MTHVKKKFFLDDLPYYLVVFEIPRGSWHLFPDIFEFRDNKINTATFMLDLEIQCHIIFMKSHAK